MSIGNGNRCEKNRTLSLLLPADSVIVLQVDARTEVDPHQIEDHFFAEIRLQGFADFVLLLCDHDHIGFLQDLVDSALISVEIWEISLSIYALLAPNIFAKETSES